MGPWRVAFGVTAFEELRILPVVDRAARIGVDMRRGSATLALRMAAMRPKSQRGKGMHIHSGAAAWFG